MGQGDEYDAVGFAGCRTAGLVGHSLGFTQVDGRRLDFEIDFGVWVPPVSWGLCKLYKKAKSSKRSFGCRSDQPLFLPGLIRLEENQIQMSQYIKSPNAAISRGTVLICWYGF